jgi:hypothetical protein
LFGSVIICVRPSLGDFFLLAYTSLSFLSDDGGGFSRGRCRFATCEKACMDGTGMEFSGSFGYDSRTDDTLSFLLSTLPLLFLCFLTGWTAGQAWEIPVLYPIYSVIALVADFTLDFFRDGWLHH